jgi:hypothetical protein
MSVSTAESASVKPTIAFYMMPQCREELKYVVFVGQLVEITAVIARTVEVGALRMSVTVTGVVPPEADLSILDGG